MKIRCVDSSGNVLLYSGNHKPMSEVLTVGRIYNVVYPADKTFGIYDDGGHYGVYNRERFEIVEE